MEIPPIGLQKNDKFFILVGLFIKKDLPNSWQHNDWVREKTATKRLVNKYKDFDFFYSLTHLQGKFNSLLGLMSKKYHNLDDLYHDFLIQKEKTKHFTLESEPVIIIEDIKKKPANLMEYLDS